MGSQHIIETASENFDWAPKKPIKSKNSASSRKLLEKSLGCPLPSHKVQVNFSVSFLLSAFVSPDLEEHSKG